MTSRSFEISVSAARSSAASVAQRRSGNHNPSSSSHRPPNTPFRQQRLPKWRPLMSPQFVIPCYIIVGIAFIIVGVFVLLRVDDLQEHRYRYDFLQSCTYNDFLVAYGYTCAPIRLPINITKTMRAPVRIYYEVTNFNQNNYNYLNSKSDHQLGDHDPWPTLDSCMPLMHPQDYKNPLNETGIGTTYFEDNASASLKQAYYSPCGIIPWSKFNDTFVLFRGDSYQAVTDTISDADALSDNLTLICDGGAFDELNVPVDPTRTQYCRKKGITWNSDIGVRYRIPPNTDQWITNAGWPGACDPNRVDSSQYNRFLCNGWYLEELGHAIPATTDEDLMVWLRASPKNTFRKLYRLITIDLEPGYYLLEAYQTYDISAFGGQKTVVLAAHSSFSKNYVLGSCYVVVGTICLVFGIAFAIHWFVKMRR